MKLKGSDGKDYTGEAKGGLFAIFDADKKNVANYKDAEAAVKVGGYTIVGDEAPKTDDTPPTGNPQDAPKTESGKTTPAADAPATNGGSDAPKPEGGEGAPGADKKPEAEKSAA